MKKEIKYIVTYGTPFVSFAEEYFVVGKSSFLEDRYYHYFNTKKIAKLQAIMFARKMKGTVAEKIITEIPLYDKR